MKIKISTHAKTLISREPLSQIVIITNWLNSCLSVSPSSRQSTEQNWSTANKHHSHETVPLATLLPSQNMPALLGLGPLSDTVEMGYSKALVLFQGQWKLYVRYQWQWVGNTGTDVFCYSDEYSDVLVML